MTARQFYEACAVVYKRLQLPERVKWRFCDTDEEHERYGGTTAKELYYMFADGRDDGLRNVPMDDAEEFDLWLNDTTGIDQEEDLKKHNIFAINHYRLRRKIAKRRMKHCSISCNISIYINC